MKLYDYYKIPIQNWHKTGLTKASWCKGKFLIEVPRKERKELESTVTINDYIGRMYPEDFNKIIEAVEKLHG